MSKDTNGYTTLSDAQWCVLDLLMRAKQKGVYRLSRQELLSNGQLPDSAKLQLTWAALVMPSEFIAWHGQHEFSITDAGADLYRLRFGQKAKPTAVADSVICLPGPDHYAN